jgi:hypothetical protein
VRIALLGVEATRRVCGRLPAIAEVGRPTAARLDRARAIGIELTEIDQESGA